MQIITITGRCGKDAETRSAGQNRVTSVNVAVDQGFGDSKTTNWFRVSIWGDRGEKLAPYIKRGEKVCVTGELIFDTYEGKPQYNIRAHDIDPFMASKGEQRGGFQNDGQRTGEGSSYRQPAPAYGGSDLDDDVPF